MKQPPENKAMHGGLGSQEKPVERECDKATRERKEAENKAVTPEATKSND